MDENSGKLPLVSIGLPVYNGEQYLRQAIESLLAQDYGNFELIISDNASDDATFAICQEYQIKDKRIYLHKNDRNIGMINNFNKVFHLSAGKYFMWAAYDDLWHKSYVSKCVAKLEENPDAVVCVSEIAVIDASGNKWDATHVGMETTVNMDAAERLHMLVSRFFWTEIYGVIRSACLQKTNLHDKFGADLILLMELLLLGEFVKVPEILFMYRRHLAQMSAVNPANKYGTQSCLREPFTGLARDILQVVLKGDLESAVKFTIKNEFIECLSFENTFWRQMMLNENGAKLPRDFDIQDRQALINIMRSLLITPNGVTAEEESSVSKNGDKNGCQ